MSDTYFSGFHVADMMGLHEFASGPFDWGFHSSRRVAKREISGAATPGELVRFEFPNFPDMVWEKGPEFSEYTEVKRTALRVLDGEALIFVTVRRSADPAPALTSGAVDAAYAAAMRHTTTTTMFLGLAAKPLLPLARVLQSAGEQLSRRVGAWSDEKVRKSPVGPSLLAPIHRDSTPSHRQLDSLTPSRDRLDDHPTNSPDPVLTSDDLDLDEKWQGEVTERDEGGLFAGLTDLIGNRNPRLAHFDAEQIPRKDFEGLDAGSRFYLDPQERGFSGGPSMGVRISSASSATGHSDRVGHRVSAST